MIPVNSIHLANDSQEELLPDFNPEFPCICSDVTVYRRVVPWHWHNTVELFYIDKGTLEYTTPGGTMVFPAGSGGMVASGVPHTSRPYQCEGVHTRLYLFAPSLLAGPGGTVFEKKFLSPITDNHSLELLPIFPDSEENRETLRLLVNSFSLDPAEFGYELRLRNVLSDLWLRLLRLPLPETGHRPEDGKAKELLLFIREHYSEPLTVPQLAKAAFISTRECYRVFRKVLNTTPADYLREYRIQRACQLLAQSTASITEIAFACGFPTPSAFGYTFRTQTGCTPGEYRKSWQKSDIRTAER